jgi:hypothetical protein
VFAIENFPADRGEIHIEVWEECRICRTPREEKGSMIPENQLLSFRTFHTYEPDNLWTDMLYFPPMQYRSRSIQNPPLLNDTVDFGDIAVEYVSVVFEQSLCRACVALSWGFGARFLGKSTSIQGRVLSSKKLSLLSNIMSILVQKLLSRLSAHSRVAASSLYPGSTKIWW